MLLQPLIHPPLLRALAAAGHGSRVLIADANYPVATGANHQAETIHLNLQRGLLDAMTVLKALLLTIPVEGATVMSPEGDDPELFAEFQAALPALTLELLPRADFYAAARGVDVAAVVATGETRHFGNLLLTIGVTSEKAA